MSALLMTVLLAAGLGVFAWTAGRRWRLMRVANAPLSRFDEPGGRLQDVLYYMFGQARMFRYRAAGVAHAFIFIGFVVLGLRTLVLFARGYTGADSGFGFWLFDEGTPLGVLYTFLKDLIGVLVIAGVAYFLYLRLVARPGRMQLSGEGVAILCMILGLIVSDMTYEAAGYARPYAELRAQITRTVDHGLTAAGAEDLAALVPTEERARLEESAVAAGRHLLQQERPLFHVSTPAASTLALLLERLPHGAVNGLLHTGFWLHSIIVLVFLNLLPYGKHFHVLTVLPNVYFRDRRGIGRLRPIADIEGRLEREETLGVKTAADLSWKDVLDFYTCTECGRCSDHCPAMNTGKLLSPKHLTMDLRNHMYARQNDLIGRSRPAAGSNGDAAATPALKDDEAFQLVPHVVNPEVIWACTTCGACEQECPVFISYIDKIVDLRRNAVMEQGSFPDQLQNAFRGLESVGNPYSFDNSLRAEWAEGLNVPLLRDKPDAEVLFWVGCAPSFDDRSRRIARAVAQLLNEAGVSYAILGPEETCNGDPARRAGNEYLFQMLAAQCVETLNNHKVRKIVAACPHCFNMLGNEYPEFGGHYEVMHHTELLAQLVREGRLRPRHAVEATVVFHDSCYLGRYNDVYDPPREILRAIPGLRLVEAAESRDRGMCCGAGGAQMWKEEEHIRRPDSREGDGKVNHARARQLLRVLPSGGDGGTAKVASGCPFCKTMLSDALTDQGHESVEQADVAEYLWRAVRGE